MPYAPSGDIKLYYEETGSGFPIVFVHEFSGDYRSWENQVRWFGRHYRCITYSARGYPPSDIPETEDQYSQAHAAADVRAIFDHLDLDRAHVVGLSMGSFATLHFGLQHPNRAASLVVASGGYGSHPDAQETFRQHSRTMADRILAEGIEKVAEHYASTPARAALRRKDPRGAADFVRMLAEHSTIGSALTQRCVQGGRPSLWNFEDDLKALQVPVLIVAGDQDDGCLDPALFLKRTIPDSQLWVVPDSGHLVNLEEPAAFNATVGRFFKDVEAAAGWEK